MTPQNAFFTYSRRPIWGYSVGLHGFHDEIKMKTPNAHKNDSGIIQMIMMRKSIRHNWVKVTDKQYVAFMICPVEILVISNFGFEDRICFWLK